ncbi:hypothetical protein AB7303_20375 [Providencia rettgeri]
MMPSKYWVKINFKNKRIYDYISAEAEGAKISKGKFAEQLIEKEINRSINFQRDSIVDLEAAYKVMTRVKLGDGTISRPISGWPSGINEDYSVEEFGKKFIKDKCIDRGAVVELIKNQVIHLEHYPTTLIKPSGDITLLFIKEINVNILDVKERYCDEDEYQPKIRVAFNYEAGIVPVYLRNNILEIDILDIKHYTFAQLFQENRAYHSNNLLCAQITRSGGYFLKALDSPVCRDDVLDEINTKHPQKVKLHLNTGNLSIKNRSKQAKKLIIFS